MLFTTGVPTPGLSIMLSRVRNEGVDGSILAPLSLLSWPATTRPAKTDMYTHMNCTGCAVLSVAPSWTREQLSGCRAMRE